MSDRDMPGDAVVTVAPVASAEDLRLVDALRAGDEAAFESLVNRHGASMLRLAITWVGTRAVAEEVVQETWLGVLRGLGRFEGRSSLKTWIFRILSNTAKKRAVREGRSFPVSSFAEPGDGPEEAAVDPARFHGRNAAYPGGWAAAPRPAALGRDAGPGPRGHRRPPARAAAGHHHARRGRVHVGGGL